ncbi:MAG: sulfotransferase [Gammaproteobacteria bacterium]|nr:sulfotransferase [Gammaproteobacteria bacterium]
MRAAARLDDDPGAAAREAEQLLQEDPGNTAAALLLGTARRACGDPATAQQTFAALAAAHPQSATIQLEYGRALASQGHSAAALEAFEVAVRLEPELADAWRELSVLYAAQGNELACDAAFARYVRLATPEQHLAAAATAISQGRADGAEAMLRQQLSASPDDIFALRQLADLMNEREEYGEAEALLARSLRLAEGFSDARFTLARVLHSQQKASDMLPLLERLLRFDPRNVQYRTLLSAAFNLLGQNSKSLQTLEDLLKDFPGNERLWVYYGHALRAAGSLPQAIAAYRKAIELVPQFGEAWHALAELKTVRLGTADIAAMRLQLQREDLAADTRLQFDFALGKALEDAGDYAASFAHYASGNAIRRTRIRYEPTIATQFVERSERLYTREFFGARTGWGTPAADPIFIVGMPRSGSTLVEQILASHSQVEGTRELPYILAGARELGMLATRDGPARYPQSVAALSREQLAQLGERYLRQTRVHRCSDRARFIDKMPTNFLHVGLIHLMLPAARIIDVRRAALACCFSNFKQHFQKGMWFSYSLEDLGAYYRDYVRLMRHFDARLPGRLYRVHYEKLVTDPEQEVRRLLEYCALPFESQCLRFYDNPRPVQTVSSEQVRQPLYTSALEQWRHYEPFLGPLKAVLGELAAAGGA